jgi:hypothetical protein
MTEDDATLLVTQIEPRLSEKYPFDEKHKLCGVRVYCPRNESAWKSGQAIIS